MTTSRPLAIAALAITTALTAAACSSSNEKPTEDPTSASASQSSTTEPSAATMPSGWQTAALADVAEISVPPDWAVKSSTDALDTLSAPKDAVGFPPSSATVSVGNLAGGDEKKQLEWMADRQLKTNYAGYNPKRLPNETINGTTFYRLQFENEAEWYDLYGTVTPDGEYSIVIEWKSFKTLARAEAEAIWSPVMPTFKML